MSRDSGMTEVTAELAQMIRQGFRALPRMALTRVA